MEAPIVTLTTDWGDRDFFAAMVKGRLCSSIPGVRIFDLSHRQSWSDPLTVSNIIRYGCLSFPEGSVHIVDVGLDQVHGNDQQNAELKVSLLAQYKGHYFISSSRKLLELAIDEQCDTAVRLPLPDGVVACSFLAHSQYCDIVSRLLSGEAIQQLGLPVGPLCKRSFLRAQVDGNRMETRVISVDSYGNLNLNISYEEFESIRGDRPFRVELIWQNGLNERCDAVTTISRHYSDVNMGELLLTVSSTGCLQLAMNKDSAASLIGMSCSSRCVFYFSPKRSL